MRENTKSTIFKAASILAVFTLLSRLVGLYRDHLFAAHFGAGDLLDSYYAAFRIPDLVFNIFVLGTLSVAFIPVFTEYFITDKDRAERIGNTVLSAAFTIMAVLCGILYLFVPEVTRIVAPGFTGVKFANTVMLTKIFLLSPIIFTISAVFASVLNSLKRFALVSIAPIIYNFGIIFGIVYLYPRYGLRGLGWGVILGAVAHFLMQMFGAMSAGFRIRFAADFRDPALRKIGRLFFWRIFSVDNAQISLLLASIIGSTLLAGTIAVFNLANNLQAVVIGMFGISFATAAFPDLSQHFAKKDTENFNSVLSRTAVHILFFSIPISVLFIVLRAQIVRVVLGSGNFNWQDTLLTANTLGLFAISIFAQGLAPLISRAFYAMHNTFIPAVIGLVSIAINGLFAVILGRKYGVVGLSAAFTIANIANLGLLWFGLRKRLVNFNARGLVLKISKIVFATLILAIATYAGLHIFSAFTSLNTTIKVLVQGVFAGGLGLIAFVICALLIGLDEIKAAGAVVKGRLFR